MHCSMLIMIKRKLLIECGIDVNKVDIDGNNALYRASYDKSSIVD